jgi:signal transduction histidine kinase
VKLFVNKNIEKFVSNNLTISIIIIFNLTNLLMSLAFYPLIPLLMGYPKGISSISDEIGASYMGQFLAILVFSFIIGAITILIGLRGINKWRNSSSGSGNSEYTLEIINKVRSKYINIPYLILVIQFIIVIPLITIFLITRNKTGIPLILIYKLIIVILSLYYMISIISYVFLKKVLTNILLNKLKGECLAGLRLGLKSKIFLQVIPLMIVGILFTSLLGYSRLIKEKGDLLYLLCKDKLEEQLPYVSLAEDKEQVFKILQNIRINDVNLKVFMMDKSGEIASPDNINFPSYYVYYIKNPSMGDRVYGDTEELQGVVAKVDSKFGPIKAGLRFEVASKSTVLVFMWGFISILGVALFIIYYFSKNLSNDIAIVAKSINEIAEGKEVDLRKRISVTSNDEIGDLVVAFNKIREREFEYDNLRNEFFSNISHELRTPINIILATIQFLEKYKIHNDKSWENDKVGRHLEVMKKNGYRLLRLVNNIIDSTRIDVSTFNVSLHNWDIVKLVREITNSVEEYVKGKDLEISFETSVNSKVIACDQNLIERIMLNLLSNAVKFTGEGGKIAVGIFEEGEYINISVKDNGIGIDQENHSIIFERFGQVEHTLKRSYEGSGIGLSLVKTFVEMNGGTILVNSECGKGSEFVIKFPVRTLTENREKNVTEDKIGKGFEIVSIELADLK